MRMMITITMTMMMTTMTIEKLHRFGGAVFLSIFSLATPVSVKWLRILLIQRKTNQKK